MKNEPTLKREELETFYDRCSKALYGMVAYAVSSKVNFYIKVTSKGEIVFESVDNTEDSTYLKSITQTNMTTEYWEKEIKKGNKKPN